MSQLKTVKIKDGNGFQVINESDFNPSKHELCEGEELSETQQLTVQLNTEIAPGLQKAIDDAKAEYEKVAAENEALKVEVLAYRNQSGLVVSSDAHYEIVKERDALSTKVKELGLELEETKQELVVVKGEAVAFMNDVAAMQARINELQPALEVKETKAKAK